MTGILSRLARTVAIAALLLAPAAASATPALLGTYKAWTAYATGSGANRTCYALGQPKSMEPKKVARDAAYFLISDWPSRKARAETEVVPGYPYKLSDKVTVQVGSDKFSFFTKNEGSKGQAWVEVKADEERLVEAMRRGSDMFVTGTSERGTLTRDTYSLDGISSALDKIHQACGM